MRKSYAEPLFLILLAVVFLFALFPVIRSIRGDEQEPDDPAWTETDETEPPETTEMPVTEPLVTEPPVTEPPVTEPPVTEPFVTEPPVTKPPVTDPPVTTPPETKPDDPPVINEIFPYRVDASFFDDALFIGDSRTESLANYGTLKNADYYCFVGASLFNLEKKTHKVLGLDDKEHTLEELITSGRYTKFYITLGFNEQGYSKNNIKNKYTELVNRIEAANPGCIIVMQANLHVTTACAEKDKNSDNGDINKVNDKIKSLADYKTRFYVDPNPLFDNAEGALDPQYTGDGSHLYARYYKTYCEFLMDNGVKLP